MARVHVDVRLNALMILNQQGWQETVHCVELALIGRYVSGWTRQMNIHQGGRLGMSEPWKVHELVVSLHDGLDDDP